jgi:hypothetical protein
MMPKSGKRWRLRLRISGHQAISMCSTELLWAIAH